MSSRRQPARLLILACVLSLTLVQCNLGPAPTPTPPVPPNIGGAEGPTPTLAVSPSIGGQGGVPRGGTYTLALIADAVSLQPLLTSDSFSSSFQSLVYDILFERDIKDKGALTPKMAESYSFSEDNLTLTVNLRRGMLWSDGRPITADDFLFTWAKLTEPQLNPAQAAGRSPVFASLQASDPYTLVYKLNAPDCTAVVMANMRPLPKHIFETVDIRTTEYNMKPPVSSGPFILQEWVKDDHATYVANDRYFGGRPNLDKVVIRVVKDANVAAALFRTQEIDSLNVSPADWDSLRQLPFALVTEAYSPNLAWWYVVLKMDHPVLQDKAVRQALSYALDKKSIVDTVYLGHARALSSFVHPDHWAYTTAVTSYDYNPDKAKAILKEAGWGAGSDGVLVKDGKPLKLRLHYLASDKPSEQTAVVAQANFGSIGAAIEIMGEEAGALLNRMAITRDFDLILMGSFTDDPHNALRGTSEKNNAFGYANAEIDRLRAAAVTVAGCRPEDRQKVYAQALKIITDDAPAIYLVQRANLTATNTRLEAGVDPKTGAPWPIEKWYVKPGK